MQKLYASLKDDITQEGLTLAGSWVIGEYGDALLRGGQYEEEELVKEVKEGDLVDLFETILNSSYAGQIVTEYIITSAMKLTTRFNDAAQVERLRRLLLRYGANLNVEIQQRSAEYINLFGYDEVRRGVLEKMPAPEIREEQRVLGKATEKRHSKASKKKPSQISGEDMLLDLMGGSDMPGSDFNSNGNGSQNNADLLADILGGSSLSSPAGQTTSPPPKSNVNSILDLFDTPSTNTPPPAAAYSAPSADLFGGMSSPPQASPPPASGPPAHPAYNKNDLQVTFQLQRNANAVQVLARFRNTGAFNQLSAVSLQAAVPKSQKLQLQPISQTELGGGQEATQQMRVTAVNGVCCVPYASCLNEANRVIVRAC